MLPNWLKDLAKPASRRPYRRPRVAARKLQLELLENRLAPALVAAYAFDEGAGTTVNDLSGSGNTGTIVNAAWTTAGKYGDALSFGGNAYVNIPDTPSLELSTGMTLEAWVNPTIVSNNWRDVLYKGNDNYYLSATSSNGAVPDGAVRVGSTYLDTYGTAPLTANTWTHLAVTYDGSSTVLYVNGSQVSSTAFSGSIITSTNALQIGGDTFYGQYFSGTIDEVRVYNTPLTATQIQTDMNTPIDTVPPTAPSNLSASAANGNINLTWTGSTDNESVSSYIVQRKAPGSSSFVQIGTATGTSYSDTSATGNNQTYTYQVQASDPAGNLSPFSNQASATTPPAAPPATLVAAYAFDEGSGTTVKDLSGHGNTGTINNATWTTAGKYGDALSFNGFNAYVNIPDSPALELSTGMTLEAWVNPTAVGNAWRDVIYKGNDNFYLSATSTTGAFPVGAILTGSTHVESFGTSALATNTWTHLAATYDGSTVALYVNGVQVSSHAFSGSIVTSTNALQIGGDTFYGQWFSGLIDQVRVYNAPLSASQILTDMNTSVDNTPPTAPSNLQATPVSSAKINLSWAAATDDESVSSYILYRQNPGSSTFTQIATTTGTVYSDSGLSPTSTYTYQVIAQDPAGNLSQPSSQAAATTLTPDLDAPDVSPSNLTVTPGKGGELDLSWVPAADFNDGISNYLIERANQGSSTFTQIGTATGTTYKDTGLAQSTTYTYQVRAVDNSGNFTQYTNQASGTTLAQLPGLVAAYSFNEGSGTTAYDYSGNGNPGQVVNATWTAGKYGNALLFGGSGSYVTIPDSPSLELTTGMTLEAWVNPAGVNSNWRDVIYKGIDNYYLSATSSHGSVPDGEALVGGVHVEAFGTSALAVNTWTHLAATYDGTAVRLYVNGVQVSSTAFTGNIVTSTNPLQIGGDTIYGQFFTGAIDEVRIYNVALTPTQIVGDMNTPLPPDTQPPSAPGNLTATTIGPSQINLSWSAASDDTAVTGYVVLRQNPGSSTYVQVGATTGTTFTDTHLTPSSPYSYEVEAQDTAGLLSSPSSPASATTQPPDLDAPDISPSNLTASMPATGEEVDLSWTAAADYADGITNYMIERQDPFTSTFVQIATTTGTTYNDLTPTPNSTYSYRVRAVDLSGNFTAYTNTVTSTTSATLRGLVAAYSFDEGSGTIAHDSSGNGNNGTISNATWTTGKYGSALSFNGARGTWVTINDAPSLHLTTGITEEAWVQLPTWGNPGIGNQTWQDVIMKGSDNYYLSAASTFNITEPAGEVMVNGTHAIAYGTGLLPANKWQHLAATYDGTAVRLYVNGVLVTTTPQTGPITTSTGVLQIGGDSAFGNPLHGLIDEVRIYNTPMSQAQIQADMSTSITPDTQAPTTPTNLATKTIGSQVDLSWTGSTDNVAVRGYLIERQDPGNPSFVQIGSTVNTFFVDNTVAAGSTYSYRIRAADWTGNLSTYSTTATVAIPFGIDPQVVTVTPGQTAQFTANSSGTTWSVDGVVGGSAATGTITSSGLYTAPSTAGTHTVTGTNALGVSNAAINVTNYSGTTTYHNDLLRTGANLNETVLTPANVNSANFGKLFTYQLDGQEYASPLYIPSVNIPGLGVHNVLIVATEHDSVYAFDADGLSTGPLWQTSFINPAAGITTIPTVNTGDTGDLVTETGITSTPVFDPTTGTLYVEAATMETVGASVNYVQRLHALDVTTGTDRLTPAVIQGAVPGTGAASAGGQVPFIPLRQMNRPALLLTNGTVYVAFGSHADQPPYHGWLFGYNAATLQQTMIFCTSPNNSQAGIWQSGGGMPVDAAGNIYFTTGNGFFDVNTGGVDYGDTIVKISPSGTVVDYYTPPTQQSDFNQDLDVSSSTPLLLPDQPGPFPHELVQAYKDGNLYLINRDNMGHYNPTNNPAIQFLSNVFPSGGQNPTANGNFSIPVYFNGWVYYGSVGNNIDAFKLTNGLFAKAPTSKSPETFGFPGATMAISANGNTNGILWAIQRNGAYSPAVLRAYDATNLATELYNSSQAGNRDTLDYGVKFNPPLVANGRVYVPGMSSISVFGLLPVDPPPGEPAPGDPALADLTDPGTPPDLQAVAGLIADSWSPTGTDASQPVDPTTQAANPPDGFLINGSSLTPDVTAPVVDPSATPADIAQSPAAVASPTSDPAATNVVSAIPDPLASPPPT
jgi:fibronectin type 3 domain-containing protein